MANNSAEALGELRAFQGSRRKSQDILRESETRLGLPSAQQRQAGLRAAITNTENLIRAVDPSVSGRTSGQNVTEAQKTRLIGLERAPLDESFREQSRAYEGETAGLNQLQDQAFRESQLAVADDESRETGLKGLYDVLYRKEQDEATRAEQIRQYNEDLAFKRQQADRDARIAQLQAGKSDVLARILASQSAAAAPTSAAAAGPTQQQQNDYRFVKGLIDQVTSGNGNTVKLIIEQARGGNARSKEIMRAFYQLQNKPIPQNFRSFL